MDTVAIFSLIAYVVIILSFIAAINIIHSILIWLRILKEHPEELESEEETMIKETKKL